MIAVTVTDIADETTEVRRFRLAGSDGRPLPGYDAGAHIDVTGPTGITRQYSLCGPPQEGGTYTIAVKRQPSSRGGSAALHELVGVGAGLTVGTPRNRFAVAPEARHHMLVAAGIGITPLLSMAYRLHRDGSAFELHYFDRSREHAAFVGELEEAAFAPAVQFHFGVPRAGQQEPLDKALAQAPDDTHLYTCGPEGFMASVTAAAARTLPETRIHLERFHAPEATEVAAAPEDGHDPAAAFELVLDTGETFTVPPGDSIVSVLEAQGVPVDTSCREGICGTCVLTVLDGEPDHRDHCLSRKERAAGDRIAACVSRSRTPRLVVGF
ncbi:MAG: oxidoreductase [Streptomycetaceae bacterium]|nr:oxidoreductase [Streptomycetaceae bacterium]